MQIDIGFDVWKQLTSLLLDENDTHDGVLRRLLKTVQTSAPEHLTGAAVPTKGAGEGGAFYKGVHLPNGTRLRASHRGRTYFATIAEGIWRDDETGEPRNSPSSAASAISKTSLNGWNFWLAKRPHDTEWQSLQALRSAIKKA